jgi:hypothetical protein
VGLLGGKAKPAKLNAPRAITSAAEPVRLRNRPELEKIRQQQSLSQSWQLEAWRVYDNLGEINYALNLIANNLSRIRLHAAVAVSPDEPPTEVTDSVRLTLPDGGEVGASGGIDPRIAVKAREYIADLGRGEGVSTLFRLYGLNRLIAGECYLCLVDGGWSVKSTSELTVDPSGSMRLQPSASTQTMLPRLIPKSSTVIRMWTRHPRFSADPDCSLRAVLFLCEQLISLNRMINNTVRSRMNAGILKVAASIIEASRTPGAEYEDPSPFEVELHATMTQPIEDDAAGAAVIPMLAVVPDELVGPGVEWMTLARDIDQHMITYAENVLTRILNGIAIPKDAITGFQNVRFSNAQQISEDMYKQAVEPLALAFCDDITVCYLRPLMQAAAAAEGWDQDEVAKVVAWYDPSEVVTRPDRGADADAGWDRGALSDDAWRKAHGFGTEDAPTEDELLIRMILKAAQLPPNLVDYVAREVLPQYFKGAGPLVTKAQAGMSEDAAATRPLGKAQGGGMNDAPAVHPAGSEDQTPPPGGRLPPRTT